MPAKIKAWSYSRYSVYAQCPAKAKYQFIDKLPQPPSEATERGKRIHKLAEDYVTGRLPTLPPELKLFAEDFALVRESAEGVFVEEEWAFTKAFANTADWFDWQKAWCRVKPDLRFNLPDRSVCVVDHKTGKPYDGHAEQLELTALATFVMIPSVQTVVTENWYIDHGPEHTEPHTFERRQAPELQVKWARKVSPMLNDTVFSPRPSFKCKWCPYSKQAGGPCPYGE